MTTPESKAGNERRASLSSYWPVLLAFFVFGFHALKFNTWLIDDAAISFAYAHNVIHGHGLVAQVGAEPVEGFSNPLWTFLVAPLFIAAPVDPTPWVKLLSMGIVLMTFFTVHAISRCLFPSSSRWANLVTVSTLLWAAANTSFVVWTTSGLENPLYALLATLYALATVRQTSGLGGNLHSRGQPLYAGLAAAGLSLTRPDGLLFLAVFPFVVLVQSFWNPTRWKVVLRQILTFAVSALLPYFSYLLIRIAYFKDYVPNTYHAKGGPSTDDVTGLLLLSSTQLNKLYDLFNGMLPSCAGILLVLMLIGLGFSLARKNRNAAAIALLPLVLCSLAVYALLPPDWMGEYRFATPVFLLFPLALFGLLADGLIKSAFQEQSKKTVFLLIAVSMLGYSAVHYQTRSNRFAQNPAAPFHVVSQWQGLRFNHYADALGIKDASFLTTDLGGTLYFSRHRVYDLVGLCDKTIAPLMGKQDKVGLANHVFSLLPTFIHVHDFWSYRSGLFDDARFRSHYTAISESESVWAQNNGLSGLYSGDYVLTNAVSSPESLARLDQLQKAIAQDPYFGVPAEIKNASPFPRD